MDNNYVPIKLGQQTKLLGDPTRTGGRNLGTDQKLATGIWELTRVGPPLFGHNCPIDKSTIF